MKKFLKSILLSLLCTALILPGTLVANAAEKDSSTVTESSTPKRVVSYFPNWGYYEASQNNLQVGDIPWDKVTHINHAFFEISKDFKIQSTDEEMDFKQQFPHSDSTLAGHFGEYKYYKTKYPNTKLLISVGGWTRSEYFHETAKTADSRKIFANSMVDFMKKYPFVDGFDLDWEYPCDNRAPEDSNDRGCVGGPEDKQNFTLLLKDIREIFDANGMEDKLLTVAVSANEDRINDTEPDKYVQYVDYIGIMTYDYAGDWDNYTGHLAGLYKNSNDSTRAKFNMDYAMKVFSSKYNVPKDKLLGGVPLYSRGWGGVNPGPNGDGLFQSAGSKADGPLGVGGQYSWYQLKGMENKDGWTKYYDSAAESPYLYNASKKEFLTYNDEKAVQAKIDYVNTNGYGGLIVWDISGDDVKNGSPMHTLMYTGLVGQVAPDNSPAEATLTVDNATNKGNYTVTAKIPANSKATSYKLYENETVVKEGAVTDAELTITLPITDKADGTYVYKVETINSEKTTDSSKLTVTVSQKLPKPLAATLSVNNATNNGSYTITAKIPANSNATSYNLYEGSTVVKTGDITNLASTITFDVKDKAVGTYTYKIDTINDDNTTSSDNLVVTVTDLPSDTAKTKPASPMLSHNAWWGNNGNYTITMNMWWGENASQIKWYENGKLIATKNLNYKADNSSQSDSINFTNKPAGTYKYKVELINSKGITESSEITITSHYIK